MYIGVAAMGSAVSDPVWQIRKISKTDNVTSILYADSDDDFNNIWNNRLELNYS